MKERGPPASETSANKRKLSYIEQREWDGMEEKILEAEQDLAAWHDAVQEAASDPNRLPGAYEKLQEAQARVEELYARWAELESRTLGGQA